MNGKRRMTANSEGQRATDLGLGQESVSSPTVAPRALPRCLPNAFARACAIAVVAVAFTGCGNIEPWVKPYERQQIADPIMSFNANPVSRAYLDHVFEAREGARGGLGSAGGGCGCN